MIPYFTVPSFHLFGPIHLQAYGALIAVGILVAYPLIMRRALAAQVPEAEMRRALLWTFGLGLVGAHVVEILFYQPQALGGGLSVLLHLLTGLSSIGAFFGGLIGLWMFCRRRNSSFITYLAIVVEGFVIWWAFVRLGCALAHDHLGTTTNFFLAVNYPSGARHNVGLYEFLMVILVLFPLTIISRKRGAKPRSYIALIFISYGALRLALDFLRAADVVGADPRYAGLTAAQYGCAVLLITGLWMWVPLLSSRFQSPSVRAQFRPRDSSI